MLTPLYILSCSKQRFISQRYKYIFLKIIKKKRKENPRQFQRQMNHKGS